MSKQRTVYRCGDCGGTAPQWAGRCPGCAAWNTLVEELERPAARAATAAIPVRERAVPIIEVDACEWKAKPTRVDELDRVLAGGVVPGSVTLLGGEPGIGKSTLLTQAAAAMARAGAKVLYVSAEESRQQVRLRAERLGALAPRLWLASETALPNLIAYLDELRPDVLVVDSIQTVHDPDLGPAPGSVGQVRECAYRLVREAKGRGIVVFLVGHVTKDGGLAGPRVLEHIVDTVLAFEGDRHHALRLLRAVKHRFGSTSELGLFEMSDGGLTGVPDASGLFLSDRRPGVAGSAVVPSLEGQRPLLVELQALVAPAAPGSARRSAQGLDPGRLAMLLAVLERRAGLPLVQADVFALAVGGVRITEPGADLAIALAIASAATDSPLPDGLVACAEIGLGGELRQVSQISRRLAEAARLGFTEAIVAKTAPDPPQGMSVRRVTTLSEASNAAGLALD